MIIKLTASSPEYYCFFSKKSQNLKFQFYTPVASNADKYFAKLSCNWRHNVIMDLYNFLLPIDKTIFVVCMPKVSLTLSFAVEGKGKALFINWSLPFSRLRVASGFKDKREGKILAHARDLEIRDMGLGAPKIWRPPPSIDRAHAIFSRSFVFPWN